MSKLERGVTGEHFAYLRARTTQEDAFLEGLRNAATAADIPSIWITPEQGAFLQILLRSIAPDEVVEVGTLAGVSALWMARALGPGGRVRTLEIDPQRADFAEHHFALSDAAGRIEVHRGDARETLPGFADRSADLMFLDADKPSYDTYLDHALRIVRPGGVIVVDNALAFGSLLDEAEQGESVRAVRAFNDRIAQEARLQSVLVPLGDGMWIAHVLAE